MESVLDSIMKDISSAEEKVKAARKNCKEGQELTEVILIEAHLHNLRQSLKSFQEAQKPKP